LVPGTEASAAAALAANNLCLGPGGGGGGGNAGRLPPVPRTLLAVGEPIGESGPPEGCCPSGLEMASLLILPSGAESSCSSSNSSV
jgi:hypothetical protein